MKKFVKKIMAVTTMAAIIGGGAIVINFDSVEAKSLKDSFSGYSKTKNYKAGFGSLRVEKKTYALTKDYYNSKRKHYVRAYIGGSRNSVQGAVADSQRQYSFGDVTAVARHEKYTSSTRPNTSMPTGYAKYGE